MWSLLKSIPIIAKLLDSLLAWWRDYSTKLDEIRAETRRQAKDQAVDAAIDAVLNPPAERLPDPPVGQQQKTDGKT